MGVGVHQHIRTGVTCSSLHRLDVTAGDYQLILLDHVLPELVLPLHKVLAVANDLFRAQPSVSSQGHEAEVQVGRFLVHVDNSREKGIRALSALQKFQGVRKVRPDLPVGLMKDFQ